MTENKREDFIYKFLLALSEYERLTTIREILEKLSDLNQVGYFARSTQTEIARFIKNHLNNELNCLKMKGNFFQLDKSGDYDFKQFNLLDFSRLAAEMADELTRIYEEKASKKYQKKEKKSEKPDSSPIRMTYGDITLSFSRDSRFTLLYSNGTQIIYNGKKLTVG